MKTNLLIVLGCSSACVAIGGALLRDTPSEGSDGFQATRRLVARGSQDVDVLPGPLIQTNNRYLDGRADWLTRRFNTLFRDALDADHVPAPNPRAIVHRQPFTDGPWLDELSESEARTRQTTESQTVEAHLVVEVTGVSAERLLQFLVFSGYQKSIEGVGELEHELFFHPISSPLPELGGDVSVEPHQFILRETTQRPEFLAQPTGCYYIFDARRLNDAYLLRYDLLANSRDVVADRSAGGSGKKPATVLLSAGQYVMVPSNDATRLHHVVYYSGQSMPALFDEFVKNHTIDFYQKMEKTIRTLCPSWDVPAEARSWTEKAFR